MNNKIFLFLLILSIISFLFIIHNSHPSTILLSFDVEEINTPEQVTKIIDALENNNIAATFFLQGKFIEQNPNSVNEIIKNNHEIGCHTYSHPDITKISEKQLTQEILKCNNLLKQFNITPKGFRAPYNKINNQAFKTLKKYYFYDASLIKNLHFYKTAPLPEVRVSSFLLLPLEDVIFIYYLKISPKTYFYLLSHLQGTKSYLFHPQHVTSNKAFIEFKKFLATTNKHSTFLTHQEFLKLNK